MSPPEGLDRLACLAGRSWSLSDLPGGLTNRNVRVTTTDDGAPVDVVVRCWQGDGVLLGIDRDAEHHDTLAAARAGVGAAVVDYRPDLGMMVIGYLEGTPLVDASFDDADVLTRAARGVRRLHAGPPFARRFDMHQRQAGYRATITERGFALPASYDAHAEAWSRTHRALSVTPPVLVPCNNDLLAANFIDDGTRVALIDYEYAGGNDPAFELGNTATECGFSLEQTEAWVAAYHGSPTRADLARVRLQALCSAYGWALWGFIQAATSPISFDFTAWGCERLDRAAAGFGGPAFDSLLEDVCS